MSDALQELAAATRHARPRPADRAFGFWSVGLLVATLTGIAAFGLYAWKESRYPWMSFEQFLRSAAAGKLGTPAELEFDAKWDEAVAKAREGGVVWDARINADEVRVEVMGNFYMLGPPLRDAVLRMLFVAGKARNGTVEQVVVIDYAKGEEIGRFKPPEGWKTTPSR